jgi:4-hydroxy-3-polyprenylbenzoate decarboxylase
MGAIRRQPVELIKCETSDLLVPATAEIVVEGTVSPDPASWEIEGPFGENTGYFSGAATRKPTIQINCITYRDNPIYRATLEGFGPGHPNEDGIPTQASVSANVWNVLERANVPGILDVYALPASAVSTLAIKIKKVHHGHAKQAAMAVWGSGDIPDWQCKTVIVVEEDIDIYDFESLEWAFAYRVNAGMNDLLVIPGTHGNPLDPSTPLPERNVTQLGTGKWNRLLIDATRNWELGPQELHGRDIYPPVSFLLDPEDEKNVVKRWKELGLEDL